MPTKIETYVDLAEQTTRRITESYGNWTAFLGTVGRLYKYSYHEQLMIYAQRPDATACASYDIWNDRMGRYIRRGSKGIALVDISQDTPKIKYVFDVSDTGSRKSSKDVNLWRLNENHAEALDEMLEERYDIAGIESLEDKIERTASVLADEYWENNRRDIIDSLDESYFSEYDELNRELKFRNAVTVSAAYTIMARCGLNPDEYFEYEDFQGIFDFNTPDSVTALGTAVSEVSEDVLRSIEITIKNHERTQENGLHSDRRLSDSKLDIDGNRETTQQIRQNEEGLSQGTPPDIVQSSDSVRQTERTPDGDRRDSEPQTKPADGRTDEAEQHNGAAEIGESNTLDAADEQPEISSGGGDSDRADIQLSTTGEQISLFPTELEQIEYIDRTEDSSKSSVFSFSQDIIDAVLRDSLTPNERMEVVTEFSKSKSTEELTEFLQKEYVGGRGFTSDGVRFSVWFGEEGIKLAQGESAQYVKSAQTISWTNAADRVNDLLTDGNFVNNVELTESRHHELHKTAEHFWYLHQSFSTEAEVDYFNTDIWDGGFPESVERIANLLADPDEREKITVELQQFSEAYGKDSSLLRFNQYSPEKVLSEIYETAGIRKEFTAERAEIPKLPQFINDDMINSVISYGNNVSGRKGRIYEFFTTEHSMNEKATFLREEYGTGGRSNAILGDLNSFEDYTSKGMTITRDDCSTVQLSWTNVAERVDELVRRDRYILPREEVQVQKQDFTAVNLDETDADLQDALVTDGGLLSNEDMAVISAWFRRGDENLQIAQNLSANFAERNDTFFLVTGEKADYYSFANGVMVDVLDENDDVSYSVSASWEEIAPILRSMYESEKLQDHGELDSDLTQSTAHAKYKNIVAAAISEDEAYRNACINSDRENAVIEGNAAVRRAVLKSGDMELIRLFSDDPDFSKVIDEAIDETYQQLHEPIHIQTSQNFRITDENLGIGGPKAKFRMNMDAINLLKQLETENRQATPEEQLILSKYVGWGGLAEAFDEDNSSWIREYNELKAALTDEEYTAARASTLNAHYTSPTVIKAIYEAVENMGFQTGNILEPSMGVGNFFGLLPESMSNSHLYGVELDSITGRIAKQLYPNADITVTGFETTDKRDFFDLAVGNVPFGNYKVNDKDYNKLNFSIHDYFFAKAIDQVRPGGVIAFVTSHYTMDKESPEVRKYIAERAELLGAIRLPNNAFKANAGTEVVSDILFLQKRDRPIVIEPDWVHLGQNADGFSINSYFVEHPDMILGTQSSESTQYGKQDFTVEPIEGANLSEQLHEAVQHIKGTYREAELPDLGEAVDISIPADPNVKNYSYAVVDGEVYYRENSRMVKPELNQTSTERIKGMVELRDCVHNLIDSQLNGADDGEIKAQQFHLNELYDNFSEKYGLINDRANRLAFSDDSSYYLLCSLEILDEEQHLKSKADMFTKRTIKPNTVVTSVDTASEALAVSISEKARVDIPYMSQLTGKSEDELVSDLCGVIFRLPELPDTYVTADEYLSGNVREKLAEAEKAAESDTSFAVNVEALRSAQPKELDASEIEVRLGATWIDKSYIRQFMFELLNPPFYARRRIDVNYSEYTAEWNISGKTEDRVNINSYHIYGTDRANAYRILEDTLNLRDVRIYDTIQDADGKERRVLNTKETTLAQQKQQSIKDAFRDWIWKDPGRRHDLVQKYNELFNSTRPREYNGEHITFNGMNPEISLREHQKNAVAHILYGGNTLLAHEVGAGKTFEMAAAAMESKRLGLCSKPLFVVPNHLTEQWASEFLRLYPSANILVATKKDFEPANRKKFCARIATGTYDAVIIGHSQFEKIPMSKERQEKLLQEQISEIQDGIAELKASHAERFTVKELERTRKSLEVKLEKLQANERKDDVVTFEQLGVDRLFVDEAHGFKNNFIYTKMRNVAGLSTTDSQKSADMLMKCRYLDEITGNKGIVFATGTPVNNSMTELFVMMRYLQHDTLEKKHLNHFDAWASTFGETTTAIELAPEGTGYRARTRFAKFFNLPELMNLFKEAADIKTSDQLNLPVPKATYHNVVAHPSEIQLEMVQELSERAAKVHSRMVDPSVDNMLKITSDGRKLGLDQRIINPNLPDNPDSKVNMCVENIFRIYQEGSDKKLTQLVFSDLSTPKSDEEFSVYTDIKQKLMSRGIPEEEIVFIHTADTEVKKKELFAKVRSGNVRVLIGSTSKMGAGSNVQDKLIALHDLDVPWRPGDLVQRSGRIIRQGNTNPEVHIFRYVTEKTFDSYLWQTLEQKQKFISQIMTSKSPVRACDDIDEATLSYAEVKALCAGDERIKEKMDLDIDVARLKLLKSNHQSQQFRIQDNIMRYYPEKIEAYKNLISGLEADQKTAAEHPQPKDGFAGMEVNGSLYTEKEDAGAAILDSLKAVTGHESVHIGSYRGFDMSASLTDFGRQYVLTLKGEISHNVELGKDARGNIIRMDNALNQIPLKIESAKAQLEDVRKQLETEKIEAEKPFPQEEELKTKTARLVQLNAELNIDGKSEPKKQEPEKKESVIDKLRTPLTKTEPSERKTGRHEECL